MRPRREKTTRPEVDHALVAKAQAMLIAETGEHYSQAEAVEHALRRVIARATPTPWRHAPVRTFLARIGLYPKRDQP